MVFGRKRGACRSVGLESGLFVGRRISMRGSGLIRRVSIEVNLRP